MSKQPLEIGVGFFGHKTIDYDRDKMRNALKRGGLSIRAAARRLVSRRAISSPGEFPGMVSGTLKRAIAVTGYGSGGGWIRVGVKTIRGKKFYPIFLLRGTVERRTKKLRYSGRVEPRDDYIGAAAKAKRSAVRSMVQSELKNALIPR